jgi:hypothetical protein
LSGFWYGAFERRMIVDCVLVGSRRGVTVRVIFRYLARLLTLKDSASTVYVHT